MPHAQVNITWKGQNGDLPDPVDFDASDAQILAWVTEALVTGGVPGIASDAEADLTHFVVDRFIPTTDVAVHRLFVRPKTPFGA